MKIAAVVLIAWLVSVNAWAQTGGNVTGRVTDETGGALPGVTVELRGTGTPLEGVTDSEGRYVFENVAPGTYQLSIRLINFADVNHSNLTVAAGTTVTIDEVMHLALNAEVVVIGKRTFVNLADAEHPAENLVGIASSASQGAITAKQLDVRPFMRQGEVLETVPGVIITQHSGEGKANQYFLRGFNLDHGSDFAMTVAGTPVNMPTHAHSQGYSDINFLIPELVAGVQYSKGPYFADQGDFATAGAGNINYATTLDRPLVRLEGGTYGFGRVLMAASPKVGKGNLLAAFETSTNSGPWSRSGLVPEVQRRAALQPGRQRQRALAHVHGIPRPVECHRGVSAARDRRGPDRSLRLDRSDRRRTHLSLQRRRRMAAWDGQHADQDPGLRPRLRPRA